MRCALRVSDAALSDGVPRFGAAPALMFYLRCVHGLRHPWLPDGKTKVGHSGCCQIWPLEG